MIQAPMRYFKLKKGENNIPVGTLEATFESRRITRERSATPLALSMREYGSRKSHRALGMPVLLKPSTVMNIPQKNINREYETWFGLDCGAKILARERLTITDAKPQ